MLAPIDVEKSTFSNNADINSILGNISLESPEFFDDTCANSWTERWVATSRLLDGGYAPQRVTLACIQMHLATPLHSHRSYFPLYGEIWCIRVYVVGLRPHPDIIES
jgi:hypothetical protein